MAKSVKKRSEIEEKYTWNLKDIYESNEAWEEDIKFIKEQGAKLAAFEGKLTNGKALYEMMEIYRVVFEHMNKAYSYASMLFDQDQTNSANQALKQKAFSTYIELDNVFSFARPELLAIDDDVFESFYREVPELELYRAYFAEITRLKAHTLSPESEKLLALSGEMSEASSAAYSAFHNADMIFPEITDENGETVRLTNGNFVPFQESSDRRVRKEAFEKYYSVFKQYAHTTAALYDGQVKSLIFNAKARHYNSTLEAAVDANNVPASVYQNLIDVVNKNLDKMHRYVRLRKKLLGVDELHMYDVYTPMIEGVAKEISYEEACETVLKALEPMGEDYLAVVKEAFANRWIDVYENEGKRGGAYSTDAYGVHPYMLLNHHDTLDNMFTLIHEMGHSMHTYYSEKGQPSIYAQYKIFVAEVASTCNEVLLMEYLLKNCTDKKEKIYLLNHFLESYKGTVYRQAMFAEFEMLTNAMVERGESLTADNCTNLYLELNKKYFGEDMVSDPEIAYEWSRIPHFYYNFYVYQYATSFCASVPIARNILKEGTPAVERYKKFLSGGCSQPPVELLKIAGVDMSKPEAIQSSLDVFDEILDEIEKLI